MSVRSGIRNRSLAGVIGQLNLEWDRLLDDAKAGSFVARWAQDDGALAGLETVRQIEEATDAPVGERIDGIFYALVVKAVAGEQLAGRIVLQLMLGKVIRIADRYGDRAEQREEHRQLAVACMWEAITTFPVDRRTHHVPAHLAWDTHRAVRTAVRPELVELPLLGVEYAPAPAPAAAAEAACPECGVITHTHGLPGGFGPSRLDAARESTAVGRVSLSSGAMAWRVGRPASRGAGYGRITTHGGDLPSRRTEHERSDDARGGARK